MKKVLIWILVLVLVAVVSIIGTIAYLTAVDDETNVMTVGDASIKILEYERVEIETKNEAAVVKAFENNKHIRPSVLADGATYAKPDGSCFAKLDADNAGEPIKANYNYPIWNPQTITNEIDKMVFVKNTGDCDVFVRLCFAFEAGNYVRQVRFKEMIHLNANETEWKWDWNDTRLVDIDGTRYFIAWATYQNSVKPGELTDISLAQIALDHSAINDHVRAFGNTYDVKVFAQGIQADGFASASESIAKHFDNSIPFKNVKEVNFVDLPTALHYLKGNTSATSFVGSAQVPNTRVSSITFDLMNEDYAEMIKGYDGTLVANRNGDADFTAYAYYIPNSDGQYDIYVLADAWEIYAPRDCEKLFGDMAGVKKIDTTNLNVSKTKNMAQWFNRCKALETIDVSNWDVSNVTNMYYLFNSCNDLKAIDVGTWDVSNVENMNCMFANCDDLTTLDVADWDVSKVSNMAQMFGGCSNLTELDLNSWNTGALKNISSIFRGCGKLTTLNLSKWNVTNVEYMGYAFASCKSLTSLDLSSWDVSSATTMENMFQSCFALVELNISSWTTDKVTKMSNMFDSCHSLASLDLSEWNTKSVTTTQQMFGSCFALKSLKLPENVSAVTNMSKMFYQCRELTELDLSAWDITKEDGTKINMDQMFYMGDNQNVGKLKTIYVGEKWDPAYIGSSSNMFFNAVELPGYSASAVDVSKAHAGEGGYLTKK